MLDAPAAFTLLSSGGDDSIGVQVGGAALLTVHVIAHTATNQLEACAGPVQGLAWLERQRALPAAAGTQLVPTLSGFFSWPERELVQGQADFATEEPVHAVAAQCLADMAEAAAAARGGAAPSPQLTQELFEACRCGAPVGRL